MRQQLARLIPLRRAMPAAGFTSTLVIAVALLGGCDVPVDNGGGGTPSDVDEVRTSGLTVDGSAASCWAVVGAPDTRLSSDGSRYFIYTVGSNTAAVYCPMRVASTTNAAILTQITYIDSNGGGIACQAHTRKNGNNVYSRKLISTRNTTPATGIPGLFQTTDFTAFTFSPGADVILECILGPGSLLSGYKFIY